MGSGTSTESSWKSRCWQSFSAGPNNSPSWLKNPGWVSDESSSVDGIDRRSIPRGSKVQVDREDVELKSERLKLVASIIVAASLGVPNEPSFNSVVNKLYHKKSRTIRILPYVPRSQQEALPTPCLVQYPVPQFPCGHTRVLIPTLLTECFQYHPHRLW